MKAIEAFAYNIARSRNLLSLYTELKGDGKQHKNISDLLRASIVLAVGALDAYTHDKVSENLVPAIKAAIAKKNDSQLTMLDKYVAKEAKIRVLDWIDAAMTARPFVKIRKYIDSALYKDTLQNPGAIENAMKLIGLMDFWKEVAEKLGEEEKPLRDEIYQFGTRRNKIVHEGDREKSRKLKHRRRAINVDDAKDITSRVKAIVLAMEAVTNAHMKEHIRKAKVKT